MAQIDPFQPAIGQEADVGRRTDNPKQTLADRATLLGGRREYRTDGASKDEPGCPEKELIRRRLELNRQSADLYATLGNLPAMKFTYLNLRATLRRTQTVLLVGAAFLSCSIHSFSQTQALPRIGVLWPGDVQRWNQAFLDSLRDHGFSDGVTAQIMIRGTDGNFKLGPQLARELVQLQPDVIFAASEALAKDMANATRAAGKPIPIVSSSWDPVAEGLVDNAAHPGGNVTGIGGMYSGGELMTKHLQLLKEMLPRTKRVAYLIDTAWNPDFGRQTKSTLQRSAPALGLQLTLIEAQSREDLERALNEVVRARVKAIIVPIGPLFASNRARIIDFAAAHRLPTIYGDELFAYDGGLVSYGASVTYVVRRAADLVAKLLKGAKLADIPVEYQSRFRLVVNERTAKAQGIVIPHSVLQQADEVIK